MGTKDLADRVQWQHVDEAEKSTVQEKKIRVVYLSPEGAAAVTPMRNGVNGANGDVRSHARKTCGAATNDLQHLTPDSSRAAPPAYSNRSPSPEATFTPQTTRTSNAVSRSDDEPKSVATSARESVAAAAASVPSYEELKVELEKAKEKIVSLGQESGLRMRKVAAGETSNQMVNDVAKNIQQQQGVPLQIVAALCLLCFLIAYFFF